jgi:hypothetical protein
VLYNVACGARACMMRVWAGAYVSGCEGAYGRVWWVRMVGAYGGCVWCWDVARMVVLYVN